MLSITIFSILSVLITFTEEKDVFRFASHYSNHMVLQRAPYSAVLWGFGDEGAQVYVKIGEKKYVTSVKKDFRGLNTWKVELSPFPAGGPHVIEASSMFGNVLVTNLLLDVYFGDVWVCGGQSNMVFTTEMSFHGAEEIKAAAAYHQVRLFTVRKYASEQPVAEFDEDNIIQQWSVASKESVAGADWLYFSALCWMYGRKLYDQYGIPIGLISSNYGGTTVEAWSSPKIYNECLDRSQPELPVPLSDDIFVQDSPKLNPNTPSSLWNAMIYPLLNTTIYGVIWYQGESNSIYRQNVYNCTFPAMIDGWRNEWYAGTGGNTNPLFPFGFVQLAPVCKLHYIDDFPDIRWKQTAEYGYVPNQRQPNVFMAVAMDLPDPSSPYDCIHTRDKSDVADRLLLGARDVAYSEDVYWTGPIFEMAIKTIDAVVIKFKTSSLNGEGIELRTRSGFEVETGNSTWVHVNITTFNYNEVILGVEDIKEILKVRYAWKDDPCLFKRCAIYTRNTDLPCGPFIAEVK